MTGFIERNDCLSHMTGRQAKSLQACSDMHNNERKMAASDWLTLNALM